MTTVADVNISKREKTIFPWTDPLTVEEAANHCKSEEWDKSKDEEMETLHKMSFSELVRRPKGKRIIKSKWIFKTKWRENPYDDCTPRGSSTGETKKNFVATRFKARLVAQGFGLQEGRDYKIAYAGVLGTDSARALVCFGAYYGYEIFSLDFQNFYITGKLDHDVFTKQAPGYEVKGKEDWVYLLKKGQYGLPEAGYVAQRGLIKVMTEKAGFRQRDSEPLVFAKLGDKKHLRGGFHVDDFIGIGNSKAMFEEMVKVLAANDLKSKTSSNPENFLGVTYEYFEDHILLH